MNKTDRRTFESDEKNHCENSSLNIVTSLSETYIYIYIHIYKCSINPVGSVYTCVCVYVCIYIYIYIYIYKPSGTKEIGEEAIIADPAVKVLEAENQQDNG